TELSRAVDLDSGSAARHGNLGTVLFMRGRVVDAIREYEVQVRLADGDARAKDELRRAITLDPTRAAFHSNLGYALQIEGKVAEAIAEYRTALQIDPK